MFAIIIFSKICFSQAVAAALKARYGKMSGGLTAAVRPAKDRE